MPKQSYTLEIPVTVKGNDGWVLVREAHVAVSIQAESYQEALRNLSEVLDGLIAEKMDDTE